MRNFYKTFKTRKVKAKVYNTIAKKEEELELDISEVDENVTLPEGSVLLSSETIEEKDTKYKMTPAEFVKHATIVE